MGWNVLASARHFTVSREPEDFLAANDCRVVDSEFGGEQSDARLEPDRLVELLDGVDACIVGGCGLSREVLERCPSLKVIARRGVGFDSVDIGAATDLAIAVTITPGTVDTAVADHVWALMLAAARSVPAADACVREGGWRAFMGVEVWGKTLGILGLGRIGLKVAQRAAGFDMRVIAYDPAPNAEAARAHGIEYVSLERLLQESDFVSLNVPLMESTSHLIGRPELEAMKRSAILVNTSRGPVVDEAALAVALHEGRIRGAGIDTFEKEPPEGSPLLDAPGAVLSPHTGGYSEEAMARANLMAARNVVSLKQGLLPDGGAVVNPEVWPAPWSNGRANEKGSVR